MSKQNGWACENCLIWYPIKMRNEDECPNCGAKMIKSYYLTEEELQTLEETVNE